MSHVLGPTSNPEILTVFIFFRMEMFPREMFAKILSASYEQLAPYLPFGSLLHSQIQNKQISVRTRHELEKFQTKGRNTIV